MRYPISPIYISRFSSLGLILGILRPFQAFCEAAFLVQHSRLRHQARHPNVKEFSRLSIELANFRSKTW